MTGAARTIPPTMTMVDRRSHTRRSSTRWSQPSWRSIHAVDLESHQRGCQSVDGLAEPLDELGHRGRLPTEGVEQRTISRIGWHRALAATTRSGRATEAEGDQDVLDVAADVGAGRDEVVGAGRGGVADVARRGEDGDAHAGGRPPPCGSTRPTPGSPPRPRHRRDRR